MTSFDFLTMNICDWNADYVKQVHEVIFGNKMLKKATLFSSYNYYHGIKLMCWIDPLYWILEIEILYCIMSNSCRQYTALRTIITKIFFYQPILTSIDHYWPFLTSIDNRPIQYSLTTFLPTIFSILNQKLVPFICRLWQVKGFWKPL
jgi:hypothetical protein